MKKTDLIGLLLFVIALVVLFFFWKCGWDLWATILAGAVILVNLVYTIRQTKKLKDLEEQIKENDN